MKKAKKQEKNQEIATYAVMVYEDINAHQYAYIFPIYDGENIEPFVKRPWVKIEEDDDGNVTIKGTGKPKNIWDKMQKRKCVSYKLYGTVEAASVEADRINEDRERQLREIYRWEYENNRLFKDDIIK